MPIQASSESAALCGSHNHLHKNLPVDPNLTYMNTNHILRPISLYSILILSSHLRLDIPYVLSLSHLLTNNLHVYHSHGSYIPACPFLFALITLTYDSWWPVCLQIWRLHIIKCPPFSSHSFQSTKFLFVVTCDCEQEAPGPSIVPLCLYCLTLCRGTEKLFQNIGS